MGNLSSLPSSSLEQRLAAHPHMQRRIHHIVDVLEQDIANGVTADQAEAHAREQLRLLGQDLLQDWAARCAAQAVAQTRQRHPQAISHRKKNSSGSPPSVPWS